jgi:Lon protease-like protein
MGANRFRVRHTERQADGLMLGQVELLEEPPTQVVPPAYSVLSQVLARFMEKVGDQYPGHTPERLDDANWVGYRLSELLPLAAIEKQQLLEMNDPLRRLDSLLQILPRFQSD